VNQDKPLPKLLLALPVILAISILLLYMRGLTFNPNELKSRLLGKELPVFSAPALHNRGVILSSEDIKGPALINVWASWCSACKEEHAEFMRIAKEESINVYGVAYQDEVNSALQWLEKNGDPFVWVMFDGAAELGLPLDVFSLPQTYLIDSKGVVRSRQIGKLTHSVWQSMRETIK
jgi:cytochrome c biogenesis protein CcmG, thiol:disulfide interchange protein DsbE